MKCRATTERGVPAVLCVLATLAACSAARAENNMWVGPDLGNWNVNANWVLVSNPSIHFVPDQAFNEAALINNGTTAVLSSPAVNDSSNGDVGGLKLGISGLSPPGDVENGGLRIQSGGVLRSVVSPGGFENGSIIVGQGTGQGTLTIVGNGMLSGTSLSLGGADSSSISLSNTASLTLSGTASLQRTTTLIGPSVSFNVAGNLSLGGSSVLVADIRSAQAHSPLVTQGAASIGGTLRPVFTGVTPTAGSKWTIIDAATSISGDFAAVDTSAAPALPAGQSYHVVRQTVGSRQRLELAVEEILTLQVNRVTGAVSIANIGTSQKAINGYTIRSPHGSLSGAWNSLQDQGVAGWVEQAPAATALAETTQGSSTVNPGDPLLLGGPYVKTFPAFGVDPDDLSFEYTDLVHGSPRTVKGAVIYSGVKTHNNFVLTVNPATGAVAMRNDSPFSIPIDGYAITSASGSLAPGLWNSLDDQNVTAWEQAPPAPTAGAVAELRTDGSTVFQGQTGFSLGNLFKTVGATQDLRFEFLMAGQETPSVGVVLYGAFGSPAPPGPGQISTTPGPPASGDVNGNGLTDINDYIIIRNNFGGTNKTLSTGDLNGDTVVDFADFRRWKDNVTLRGDANLDRRIDIADFFAIDRGRALRLTGYANGDFDLSGGFPNAADYVIIDRAFLSQGAALSFNPFSAPVPEPAALMLLLLTPTVMIRRR